MFLGVNLTPEAKRYFKELKKLKKLEVQVGFQSGEAQEENGADVAEIAAFNELGSSNTPARPFMRQSFENHQGELQAACTAVEKKIQSGATAEEALETLGAFCKGLVQQEIVDGGFAPNSPYTIAKKGSDQPLIDTGTMRQSVNYAIKPRK